MRLPASEILSESVSSVLRLHPHERQALSSLHSHSLITMPTIGTHPFSHPCGICGERIPLDVLVDHLDECRSATLLRCAREWEIPDDIAALFCPGIHSKEAIAAIKPPLSSSVVSMYANSDATAHNTAANGVAAGSHDHGSNLKSATAADAAGPGAGSTASSGTWYATAAAAQHGIAPVVQDAILSHIETTTVHAMIVLPSGPSYILGQHDASHVMDLAVPSPAPGDDDATITTTIASPSSQSASSSSATPLHSASEPPQTPAPSPVVRLLLGSEAAARSSKFLRANNVVAIVNCAIDSEPLSQGKRTKLGLRYYKQLQLVDAPGDTNKALILQGANAVAEAVAVAAAAGVAAAVAAAGKGDDEKAGSAAITSPSSSPVSPPQPPAVLVHCVAGISRSCSITMAYLVLHRGMSLRNSAVSVKRARKVAYPNIGFWRALESIEVDLLRARTRSASDYASSSALVAAASASPDAGTTAGTGARPAGPTDDNYDGDTVVECSIPPRAFDLHKSCPLTALRVREVHFDHL